MNGIIKPEIKEESDEMEAEQPQFDEKPVSCYGDLKVRNCKVKWYISFSSS